VDRKRRADRADGREWDGWGRAVADGPVRPATTSAFYSLPSALYFWPKAKNRGDCASFEHESQLVSEYVAEALESRSLEILL
jgi:hypothetical protein